MSFLLLHQEFSWNNYYYIKIYCSLKKIEYSVLKLFLFIVKNQKSLPERYLRINKVSYNMYV